MLGEWVCATLKQECVCFMGLKDADGVVLQVEEMVEALTLINLPAISTGTFP
jgi:hypothetical protein